MGRCWVWFIGFQAALTSTRFQAGVACHARCRAQAPHWWGRLCCSGWKSASQFGPYSWCRGVSLQAIFSVTAGVLCKAPAAGRGSGAARTGQDPVWAWASAAACRPTPECSGQPWLAEVTANTSSAGSSVCAIWRWRSSCGTIIITSLALAAACAQKHTQRPLLLLHASTNVGAADSAWHTNMVHEALSHPVRSCCCWQATSGRQHGNRFNSGTLTVRVRGAASSYYSPSRPSPRK